ncbi:MAG: ATP-binding cassette domain-containing protein [Bacilli bacterium]|jgi:methyl-galactoside transport system ATP-binding protein|nr:ATP-binding cassette domain-containing protein [Bacilli bacterium]
MAKTNVDNKTNEYLLEMKNISKSFPGVKALDHAQLRVRPGTVHSLMGENGAGKSTLMKCLFGLYKRDEGDIIFQGRSVEYHSTREALEDGIAMVQQELNQAQKMTVMDNLWLGRYPVSFGFAIDETKMYRDTQSVFQKLDIHIDPKAIISTLSVATRQMVEIAKAVSYDAKIVVFDEPTSSLSDAEVEQLFRIIKMLKKKGYGIIYISHKMDEILRISDEVTIMRDGKWVETKPAKNCTLNSIIKAMVGRDLNNRFPPKTNKPGKNYLEVKNLSSLYGNNAIKNVSFNIRKGEIFGLAGLVGAGRSELLETIFGVRTKSEGQIFKDGMLVKNDSAEHAIKNGFALLTEERRTTGIFGVLSIKDNTVIASLNNYNSMFGLDGNKMSKDTNWAIEAMNVKTPSQKTQIKSLSGGNQQKVIIGRWVLTDPDVLLLDEPTRGIDVGAKYEIYQLIINMANQGKTIIVCSSEMPELLGICDRIAVMSNHRLAGILDQKEANQEKLMNLALKYM